MHEQIGLNLLRQFDPLALSPLAADRGYYYHFLKRVLDLAVATLALVIIAPVVAVIAVLIIIDSPGPVIFAQKRVGARRWTRDGYTYWQRTTFTCYKFRSMVQNADPSVHQAFVNAFIRNDHQSMAVLRGEATQLRKLVRDVRITRVGRFIRKTSLDELPQLWNVLKGDMSLVGPRPPIPYEVDEYEHWHLQRLRAKPGITGLCQVTARCSVDFDEVVRLDSWYAEHQSLWLDLKILLKTPLAVLSGNGAV